jgi:hypothetical protein
MYRRTTFLAVIALAALFLRDASVPAHRQGDTIKPTRPSPSRRTRSAPPSSSGSPPSISRRNATMKPRNASSPPGTTRTRASSRTGTSRQGKKRVRGDEGLQGGQAWDKSIALARDESTRLLSKGGVFASDYDSLRKYLGAAARDVGTSRPRMGGFAARDRPR